MMMIALCAVACSDDDNDDQVVNLAQEVAGTYSGYTSSAFSYSPNPVITPSETVTVTAVSETTVNVTYSSDTWGEYTLTDVPVEVSGSTYTLAGSGKVTIGMHGNSGEYDYTFAGTIGSGKSNPSFTFTLPAVMGGTVITFVEGDAPAAYLVAGTYSGYTSASCNYFQGMIATDQSVTLTAASETTVDVAYTSSTWGEFTISGATVETGTGNTYVVKGTGTTVMGMNGETSTYECSLEATINSDKTIQSFVFTAPVVMGGLTVELIEGDAPAALVLAGSYTGDLTLTVSGSSDAPIEDAKVTVAAQEDGNITVTLASFTANVMGNQMTLGDIVIENVEAAAGENNAYTLSGEVNVPVSFGGATITVTGSVSGTITKGDADSAEITFQLTPGTMPVPITAVFKTK